VWFADRVAASNAAAWSDFGNTAYGYWTIDNATQTAVYAFAGGVCPHTDAPSTCVPVTTRVPLHAVGNDRHQLYLFSDGSAALRQDEGGPKLLNAYGCGLAASPQFGGAAGYVTTSGLLTAATVVNTTVSPTLNLTLALGAGFARKQRVGLSTAIDAVEQQLIAPFGDDPVVLSVVTMSGQAGTVAAYTEVWSAARQSFNTGAKQFPLNHNFSVIRDGMGRAIGLLDEPSDPSASLPGPSLQDPSPRAAFFVCLTCIGVGLTSYSSSSVEVYGFGATDPAAPDVAALAAGLSNSTGCTAEGTCASALQVEFTVATRPVTLAFMYGYVLPEEDGDISGAVQARIAAYSVAWKTALSTTAEAWAAEGSVFAPGAALPLLSLLEGGSTAAGVLKAAAAESWEARESRWHSYQLRSGLTFDSYYGNHIVSG
jgi:hypothetical protein